MILVIILLGTCLFIGAVNTSQVLHLHSGSLPTHGRGHFYDSISDFTALSHDDLMNESTIQLFIIQLGDKRYFTEFSEILQNDHDITIVNYVPDNAFIVYGRYSDLFNVIQTYTEYIVFSKFLLPTDKILEQSRQQPGRFLVHLASDYAIDDGLPEGGNLQSTRRITYDITQWSNRSDLIDTLSNHPKVVFIEYVRPITTYNDYSSSVIISGLLDGTRKETAIMHDLDGYNQLLGIVDSGLDYHHCLFAEDNSDAVRAPPFANWSSSGPQIAPDLTRRKIVQYITYADNGDSNPYLKGHGTHVSGTAAGSPASVTADSIFRTHRGVASEAKIVFFDIGPAEGSALDIPDDIAAGMFNFTYSAGARVVCNAWGSPPDSQSSSYDFRSWDVDSFSHIHKDFIAVFAAGNFGWCAEDGSVTAPSTSKNGIAVGSSHQPAAALMRSLTVPEEVVDIGISHYSVNNIASFSSRGPTEDGRIKPDLVVPGFTIDSACAGQTAPKCSNFLSSSLCTSMGTSTSAPIVSGTLVLIRQYIMEGYFPTGSKVPTDRFIPSGALLKALAINGAVHMTGTRIVSDKYRIDEQSSVCPSINFRNIGDTVPNNDQGFGRLELDRSVFISDHSRGYIQFIPGKAFASADDFYDRRIATGESHSYTFCAWSDSPEIRITLVWTDPPPAQVASKQLVNDLDLTVTTSSGVILHGNGGSSADHVNNVEVVYLKSDPAAKLTFTVTVSGYAIPVDRSQPYALVVAGKVANGTCDVAVLPSYYVNAIVDSSNMNFTTGLVAVSIGLAAFAAIIIGACCYKRSVSEQPSEIQLESEDSA